MCLAWIETESGMVCDMAKSLEMGLGRTLQCVLLIIGLLILAIIGWFLFKTITNIIWVLQHPNLAGALMNMSKAYELTREEKASLIAHTKLGWNNLGMVLAYHNVDDETITLVREAYRKDVTRSQP